LIPDGLEVTVPLPVPALVTDSVYICTLKVAVTLLASLMVTWQVLAVPVHAPLHPWNVEPALAVAVRVTTVPWAKLASHAVPQSIPAGLDVTVPLPVPVSPTFSAYIPTLNVAVTLLA